MNFMILSPLIKCNSGSKCRGFFVRQLDRARLVLLGPTITFILGEGESKLLSDLISYLTAHIQNVAQSLNWWVVCFFF